VAASAAKKQPATPRRRVVPARRRALFRLLFAAPHQERLPFGDASRLAVFAVIAAEKTASIRPASSKKEHIKLWPSTNIDEAMVFPHVVEQGRVRDCHTFLIHLKVCLKHARHNSQSSSVG
jgi:hypothetical protein